ncbi:GNAT family N-acetyltransferase [Paucibacter sp. O1-1]|uniref:GNAT family N-acetyltransferase n=1 Tax=Roseateles TaxID=93681 RepID=UPI0021D4BB69|nr:GNAT family N-acetyltransferase [Paucibacter sp. M5-1]MCU7372364.1 GNAT family N-acetyltransferase [Paucibacter sp. O1-1]MCZ7884336.1 GNAT family N-acetyltransferase [Paucibacter sp. M5-1]MDA3827356.1 GNAT family N-acetyltransferase [Paucibacter sp. O1-1]
MPGDAAVLAALCREHACYERLAPCNDDGFEARLAAALAAGRLQAWLAGRREEALGYASLTLDFATLSARPFAHLDCLYLRPAARGQGLGACLLHEVKQCAVALGCAELQWQTPDWNEAAVRFYLRAGATLRDKKRFAMSLA